MILLGFALIGGMALFLFGMHVMTEGLRRAAGNRLRTLLARTTGNPLAGLGLGTALGFLAHSGPTMVMLIGFVNAGLMTLEQSIPPVLGANLGTSLSMQLISFRLGEWCFGAIGLGFLVSTLAPQPTARDLGRALLGFGLLFLGMTTMGGAVEPHRDLVRPWLAGIHGDTLRGMLGGIAVSALVTALVQSSGATIGLCFVLARAGVFTHLEQVFPIVLGAHIGTCSMALLGAIGTNIRARRTAAAHLLFNLVGVTLAVAASSVVIRVIARTSPDLVRQTANLHTGVMLAASLLVLPMSPLLAKALAALLRSRRPEPEPSYLDPALLRFPEKAICAAIQELQRVTKVCARSFRLDTDIFFNPAPRAVQTIRINEAMVDEIKRAMRSFLADLTRRYLSRRQAVLIQHLNRCMTDIERIGDHVDTLCDISLRRHRIREARFDRPALNLLFSLYLAAERVLHLVIESLNPHLPDIQAMAQAILEARNEYMEQSLSAKATFMERIASHELPPIQGMFFNEYVSTFDRIVKHAKTIALIEKQPFFWIKRRKLQRLAEEAPDYAPPPTADAHDYLDRLQSEDYL